MRSLVAPITAPLAALLLATAGTVTGQAIFKVSELKGNGYGAPDTTLDHFYIPDRQCSGVVHNATRACRRVSTLRVQVVDSQPYPAVSIDEALGHAGVQRRAGPRGCLGRAFVSVAVGCADAHRSAHALPDAAVSAAPVAVAEQQEQWSQLLQWRRLPPVSSAPWS
ncbi:uncharacterized protein [Battus philenor]|uniref:uncharacterized protein n=1 Tax=Battus philenor TaxID=42288 RepID=UPI0035D02255